MSQAITSYSTEHVNGEEDWDRKDTSLSCSRGSRECHGHVMYPKAHAEQKGQSSRGAGEGVGESREGGGHRSAGSAAEGAVPHPASYHPAASHPAAPRAPQPQDGQLNARDLGRDRRSSLATALTNTIFDSRYFEGRMICKFGHLPQRIRRWPPCCGEPRWQSERRKQALTNVRREETL